MTKIILKTVVWVGNSLKNLKSFPEKVKDEMGYALHRVQEGKMPSNAKPLKGLGSGVMEIVSNVDTNTYRAVYTMKLDDYIYVLHTFQKKSKQGIKTPKEEIEVIKQRLKMLKAKKEARQ